MYNYTHIFDYSCELKNLEWIHYFTCSDLRLLYNATCHQTATTSYLNTHNTTTMRSSTLALLLLLSRVHGDTLNQVILAPTDVVHHTEEIGGPDHVPEGSHSEVYISGDLLCNDNGCYPLIFEPSDDWKVIKPEQRLPAGLDIRVNLDTGLKEAKMGDGSTRIQQEMAAVAATDGLETREEVAETETASQPPQPLAYEFTEQFTDIRESLQKGDYKQVEARFEEIMEFAHDYKHGFKMASNEFDLLSSVCLNTSLPTSLRELDARLIIGCLRNNPPVIEFVETHYPNFVRDIFNSINAVSKVTDDIKVLVKRFINILTVLIESDPTYIVGINDFETLGKVFYTIDDKQLKLRILQIISSFVNRVHSEDIAPTMKRDGILFVVPAIKDWVKEYTRYIKDTDIDEEHLRTFFNTLYNLKTDFGKDLKVDTPFLNWLANQVETRKAHLSNGEGHRDEEQDEFDRKLINSRHLVFGNEMADSIKNFHDEL